MFERFREFFWKHLQKISLSYVASCVAVLLAYWILRTPIAIILVVTVAVIGIIFGISFLIMLAVDKRRF